MSIIKIFTDYRQFQIFLLGAFSGMPLMVLYVTLFTWLRESNIDLAVITSFAIARVFYSLKFLWAPFVDHLKVPLLSFVGHRKSWMILCSAAISFVLYSMSVLDPTRSLSELYFLSILLGLASATFDIAFDAYRIEILEDDLQTLGAANTIFGYRMGCLVAGAGALYYADIYGWKATFLGLSGMYIACIIYILTIREKKLQRPDFQPLSLKSWKIMAIDPFLDFLKRDYAVLILLAIVLYKLGDAFLGVVAMPFYIDLGFSKSEIASVTKVFGLFATILGTYVGGYLMYKLGNLKGLIVCGIAQSLTNLSFIWLNHMGHDITALTIAIALENIAGGMGSAALVGYLSILCNKKFSATQYALFSSESGLASHSIVMYGGSMVNMRGGDMYFLLTVILAFPGLLLLNYLDKKIIK
jgi:PAT family beta-lactamase induction signal transducer AmpG